MSELSEVKKIRHYVMNLIYQNGESSVRIPSSRELTDKFQMARSTIRIALEDLTAEGYLITKRGIGTFTNPLRAFKGEKGNRIPLIGIKLGQGDQFYYDYSSMKTLSDIFVSLSDNNFNCRILSAGCKNEADCRSELLHSYVDAVLCYNTDKFYVEEAAKFLPTVSLFCEKVKSASTICSNFKPAIDRFVKGLDHQNSTSLVLWHNVKLIGLYNEFQLHNNVVIIDAEETSLDLSKYERIPDCIVTSLCELGSVNKQLKSLGVPLSSCKVLLPYYAQTNQPFWALVDHREEACNIAMDYLNKLLDLPSNILHAELECSIVSKNL